MKPSPARWLFVLVACALSLGWASAQAAPRGGAGQLGPGGDFEANPAGLGLSYVSHLRGEAFFRSADADDWASLTPNLSLRVGDRLWAGDDASVEIRLRGGAIAWLGFQSELDLVRLEEGPRADILQLALVTGEASFDVRRKRTRGGVFQVDLPNASLRSFGEARFRVNTRADGSAQVGVASGEVELEIPDGVATVRAGQLAELRPDQRLVVDFLPPFDDWDDWVQTRADLYDGPAASTRFLPPEMYVYAHEFDRSGRWMTLQPYGPVWVPTVERGWSPYTNGRWVWQAGDYVWLPYDPWYAPFHYGRWNYSASLGWFWIVPLRGYWSPGYVAWSISGSEVSWVPLGQGEVYYGYGNYGPNDVNVHRTPHINITNVYVNCRVRNAVVVVRRDDFLRGRIDRVRVPETRNPFLHRGEGGARIIGRPPVPELKPIRETRHPRQDTEVRRASRPPERVDRASEAIRQRPAAGGRERSVFLPERRPPPLPRVEKEQGVDQAAPPRRRPASPPTPVPDVTSRPEERGGRGPGRQPETPRGTRPPDGSRRPSGPEPTRAPEVTPPGREPSVRPDREERKKRGAPEAPPAVAPRTTGGPEIPAPAGRRPFKRESEPAGPNTAPPPPADPRPKGKPEREPPARGQDVRDPQGPPAAPGDPQPEEQSERQRPNEQRRSQPRGGEGR